MGVPKIIAAAAEITLISFSVAKLYFRYPSAILNFRVKEASVRLAYKPVKNLPQKT